MKMKIQYRLKECLLFVKDCGGHWGARERKEESLDGHGRELESGAGFEMQDEAAIRVIIHELLSPLVWLIYSEPSLPVPESCPVAGPNGASPR